MDAAKKQRYIFIAAVNAVSITAFVILTIILFSLKNQLPSQLAASRWDNGSGGRFTQLSVFYSANKSTDLNNIYTMRVDINSKLKENSVSAPNPNARIWVDAFSGELPITVSTTRSDHTTSVEVRCIPTGGDYFFFHPLELVSGHYYSDNDLMQDRVVIDDNLAWQLFGSSDVCGMPVIIENKYFYIAGVIRQDRDSATEYAAGTVPVMYMSFTAADTLTDGLAGISSYEVCMPDPVTGLAEKILREVSSADDKHIRILDNTRRLSLKKLYETAFDGGKRMVAEYPMVYPFWENAARIVDERAASVFTAMLVFLIVPLLTLCGLLRLLIKRRRLILKSAADRIISAVKSIMSNKKTNSERRTHATDKAWSRK